MRTPSWVQAVEEPAALAVEALRTERLRTLLGVAGIVIVGHGRSSARAIRNAILLADRFRRERLIERLERGLASSGVSRS